MNRVEQFFLAVMTISAIAYMFLMPEQDANINIDNQSITNNSTNNIGYWGDVDAELDWCEYNHIVSLYIAEPINTGTGFIYIIISIFGLIKYKNILSFDLTFVFLLNAFLGIATILFHATLKYIMQLVDELSILYLLTNTAIIAYFQCNVTSSTVSDDKNNNNNKNNNLQNKMFFIKAFNIGVNNLLLTLILLGTKDYKDYKDGDDDGDYNLYILHSLLRIYMTLMYFFPSLAMFFSSNKMINTCKCEKYKFLLQNTRQKAMLCTVISFVLWLIDIFGCQYLQNLPFGIPYLHLHAFGWHLGSAITLHLWAFLIIMHKLYFVDQIKYENLNVRSLLCCDLFPCVSIMTPKQKEK